MTPSQAECGLGNELTLSVSRLEAHHGAAAPRGEGGQRKAVQRHMHKMGIAGIRPGPNLSRRAHGEQVYSYLLRGFTCTHPNGDIDYRVWEPDSPIEIRLYERRAILRYQSRLEMFRSGRHVELARYWHTDTYEQRGGRWQVVWSQATVIQ
jgi:hypothetical protein